MSLDRLQQAFVAQLDYIETHGSALQPPNKEQLAVMRTYALLPGLTVQQFGQLVALAQYTRNWNTGFDPIEPLAGEPADTTCATNGTATGEWYFFYGNCDTGSKAAAPAGTSSRLTFCFFLFWSPVCNPAIARRFGLTSVQASVFHWSAGVALPGQAWQVVPHHYLLGDYSCTSPFTFQWSGAPTADCAVTATTLTAPSKGVFDLRVNWVDTDKAAHSFLATLSSAQPPLLDGPQGCQPCVGGLGSLYWSYVNMAVTARYNGVEGQGVGWMDHQWLQGGGRFHNEVLASLVGVSALFQPVPSPLTRWMWFTIQDTVESKQHMVVVFLSTPGPVVGQVYGAGIYNMYDGRAHFDDTPAEARVTVTAVDRFQGTGGTYVWPAAVTIQLPGGWEYRLRSLVDRQAVVMPTGLMNLEGPASVTNAAGEDRGYAFMEGSQLLDDKEALSFQCQLAGLSAADAALFAPRHYGPSKSAAFGAFALWVLLPSFIVALVIVAVVWARRTRQ